MGERLHRKLNSKLGDELLNGEIFYTSKEAKIVIEGWRKHYNTIRSHSSLGYVPPPEVALSPAAQTRPPPPATRRYPDVGCWLGDKLRERAALTILIIGRYARRLFVLREHRAPSIYDRAE
jgi:hypothetical protein